MAEFTVFCKTLTGRTYPLQVLSSNTLEDIKSKLHEQQGFPPPDQMRIVLPGKDTDSGRTLFDFNIQKESTLHVVLRPGAEEPAAAEQPAPAQAPAPAAAPAAAAVAPGASGGDDGAPPA